MGTTSTSFRGVTLLARDWKVQVWLHLLVREVDRLDDRPEWLLEARKYWSETATIAINGLVCPRLDYFLIDEADVALMRRLVQRVISTLRQFGEFVPRDFLNDLCQLPAHSQFTKDIATEEFLAYGRALRKLLDGKMRTQECA